MSRLYKVKQSIPFELKDLDESKRLVKFAFSRFDVVDSDGDVMRKGAFQKSFKDRGVNSSSNRRIQHLRYHDFTHQIGIIKELNESNEYAIAVSQLGTSTKGEDAFRDYQEGIIREHSHGFKYVEGKINEVKAKDSEFGIDYYNVTEVELYEVSAVTFGANEFTPVFDVSKGIDTDYLQQLNKEFNTLTNALKNGKGTDERLYQIEMNLRVIQSKYNSLIEQSKPSIDDTLPNGKDKPNELLSFYKNLKY